MRTVCDILRFKGLLASLGLVFLTVPAFADAPRILLMGDSFLAANGPSKKSVGDILAASLSANVKNNAIPGAKIIHNLPISGSVGFRISRQYRRGDWDWVVLNGGGNDLWFGCGCNRCDRRMDRLISEDGLSGEIPKLVNRLRESGARVVYVGYLRTPDMNSPIEHCKDDGDALEARIAALAEQVDGFDFISNQDLVPAGDRSFHMRDMIHPSAKGSRAIAERVADFISSQSG